MRSSNTNIALPFDAHNHIHMGPSPPSVAIEGDCLCGVAIMSTHPRDFSIVSDLTLHTLPKQYPTKKFVPCFGVHPWWLHEAIASDDANGDNDDEDKSSWIQQLEESIQATPNAIVGEIGLDGFHFDPTTRELTCPMETQVRAFEMQMELAARCQRPVSIHAVQCFGELLASLSRLKKKMKQTKNSEVGDAGGFLFPPKLYFHAFGGKPGTVDQLISLCTKEPCSSSVYFGFAPVVNFRSPKTANVIRHVGLERIVLETDHEDAARVPESMKRGIEFIAEALNVSVQRVVEVTTVNAHNLYGLPTGE